MLQGKVALLKKGLVFCRDQVKKATSSFQKIIRGDNSNITDPPTYAGDDETDHSDDDNVDSVDDSCDGDDDESKESSSSESISDANVLMRAFNHYNTTWIWEFPYNISQSTYQGRNGSIALLIAQGIHKVKCELYPSPMLPSVWVTLVCGCIKVGNALYDRSRGSLPQRYLSAAEAAMVAGDKLEASVGQPLPVRVSDPYPPSTIRYQLLGLCNSQGVSFAVFIVDEKTVLFVGFRNDKLVLIDTHLHGQEGAIIILGELCNIDSFLCAVQKYLGLHNDTFGNLVHIAF